jgi:hypothetical protein
MWGHQAREELDVESEVWQDELIGTQRLKSAINDLNDRLLKAQIPLEFGRKNGHVVKYDK